MKRAAAAILLAGVLVMTGCDSPSDGPGLFATVASWWSAEEEGDLSAALLAAPNAPTGLSGAATSAFTASLSWTSNSGGSELGFKLYRQKVGATWVLAAKTGPGVTTFNDPALKGGKTYNYRVAAFNSAGRSVYSNTIQFTTPGLIPVATPVFQSADSLSRSSTLVWADNSNNESGFKIEQEKSGVWSQIAIAPMNATQFTVTRLIPSTTYNFRIRAYNSMASSDPSPPYLIVTLADKTPPSAPVLTATVASPTRVTLSWTAAIDDYLMGGYHVVRDGVHLGSTNTTTRSYADLNVPRPAVDTCYVVGAVDSSDNATHSNETCVFTPGLSSGFTVDDLPFGGMFAASDGTNFFVSVLHSALSGGNAAAQLVSTKAQPIGSLSVADSGGNVNPVIWTGTKYLMAWGDDKNYPDTTMAQYFSAAGDTIGMPFVVNPTDKADGLSISVGPGGKILAVFSVSADDGNNGGHLWASIIDGRTATTPVLLFSDTVAYDEFSQASVASNGTNWLVTYVPMYGSNGFAKNTIEGRMVNPAIQVGSKLLINTTTQFNGMIGVGYGAGKFLVAFASVTDPINHDAILYARMVTANGLVASLSGGVKTLSNRPGAQVRPRIANSGRGFIVVFSDYYNDADGDEVCDKDEGTCIDLWGQKLANDGTLQGPNFAIDLSPSNQVGDVVYGNGRYFISVMNITEFSQYGIGYTSAHLMTP